MQFYDYAAKQHKTLEKIFFLWHNQAVVNKKEKEEKDANLVGSSTEVFIQYYNENIPDTFPRATLKTLEEFQTLYPSLFKENNEWIINKHRKKFMDWLSSHHEEDTVNNKSDTKLKTR